MAGGGRHGFYLREFSEGTGFDKVPEQLPKVPPIQAGAAGQQSAAAEPMPLKEEDVPKPEEPEDDPFEDIFKIFNKRD